MPARPPVLTISGGKPRLDFGKSRIVEELLNRQLQRLIGKKPNDGLVAEESVAFTPELASLPGDYEHFNSYAEYANTNHTYIVDNQTVQLQVIDWIRARP